MNDSTQPLQMVCDVPIKLHLQVSVLHPSRGAKLMVPPVALDSNLGPGRNQMVVAIQGNASDEEVRDLFVSAAENSPELLRGVWYRLHKLVCADPSAWVYPSVAVYDGVDGEYEPAHIDKDALALVWPELLERARQAAPIRRAGR